MARVASERLPSVAGSGSAGRVVDEAVVAKVVVDEAVVAQLVADVGAEPAGEVCTIFLKDACERVAVICGALDAADGDAARRAAHRLKSAAGFVGAVALAARCTVLERLLAQGRLAEACSQSGGLAADFKATADEMGRVLAGLAPPRWSPATP